MKRFMLYKLFAIILLVSAVLLPGTVKASVDLYPEDIRAELGDYRLSLGRTGEKKSWNRKREVWVSFTAPEDGGYVFLVQAEHALAGFIYEKKSSGRLQFIMGDKLISLSDDPEYSYASLSVFMKRGVTAWLCLTDIETRREPGSGSVFVEHYRGENGQTDGMPNYAGMKVSVTSVGGNARIKVTAPTKDYYGDYLYMVGDRGSVLRLCREEQDMVDIDGAYYGESDLRGLKNETEHFNAGVTRFGDTYIFLNGSSRIHAIGRRNLHYDCPALSFSLQKKKLKTDGTLSENQPLVLPKGGTYYYRFTPSRDGQYTFILDNLETEFASLGFLREDTFAMDQIATAESMLTCTLKKGVERILTVMVEEAEGREGAFKTQLTAFCNTNSITLKDLQGPESACDGQGIQIRVKADSANGISSVVWRYAIDDGEIRESEAWSGGRDGDYLVFDGPDTGGLKKGSSLKLKSLMLTDRYGKRTLFFAEDNSIVERFRVKGCSLEQAIDGAGKHISVREVVVKKGKKLIIAKGKTLSCLFLSVEGTLQADGDIEAGDIQIAETATVKGDGMIRVSNGDDSEIPASYKTRIIGIVEQEDGIVRLRPGGDHYWNGEAWTPLSKRTNIAGVGEWFLEKDTWSYTGKAIRPEVKSIFGNSLEEVANITYKNNKAAGTGSVVLKGYGRFTGTVTLSFTIAPLPIRSSEVVLEKSASLYTGNAVKPTVTVGELRKTRDYRVSYKNNTNIGTGIVVVKGCGNYTGTVEKTFAIKVENGAAYTAEGFKLKIESAKNRTVSVTGITKQSAEMTVPDRISLGGKKFRVISIAEKAFKGKKKIQILELGANISGIGANAFAGCTGMKELRIVTNKLTSKTVQDQAFSGIGSKVLVTVPKMKEKSYGSLLVKKGLSGKVKIAVP